MSRLFRIGEHTPIIVGLLVTLFAASSAFRLSPEGGYDLVLGIENPNVVTQDEQLRYIQNIKVQKLSKFKTPGLSYILRKLAGPFLHIA